MFHPQSKKSCSKHTVLTTLTFAVSQHQQPKIHPGLKQVHSHGMSYTAETILYRLYVKVEEPQHGAFLHTQSE